jgi:hypothetical protein
LALFLKNKCHDQNFRQNSAVFCVKNANVFTDFLAKIFTNHNIGPRLKILNESDDEFQSIDQLTFQRLNASDYRIQSAINQFRAPRSIRKLGEIGSKYANGFGTILGSNVSNKSFTKFHQFSPKNVGDFLENLRHNFICTNCFNLSNHFRCFRRGKKFENRSPAPPLLHADLLNVEGLVAVLAFERPHSVVEQQVSLQQRFFPESLAALIEGARELEGQVLGRVGLLLVLVQVLDHFEAAAALFASE